MTPEEKISSLNLKIPKGRATSIGSYIPITKVENLIFISGQIPINIESPNDELKYKGKVGREVSRSGPSYGRHPDEGHPTNSGTAAHDRDWPKPDARRLHAESEKMDPRPSRQSRQISKC